MKAGVLVFLSVQRDTVMALKTICRRVALMAVLSTLTLPHATAQAQGTTHMARDHLVIDLAHSVEWLRCTVGKVWDGSTCAGETVRLDHAQIEVAITQANEQLGEGWRLPTLDELEGLLCESCEKLSYSQPQPMIDNEIFPATEAEPYWTGDKNKLSSRHYYSVNFFNGWTYGRFLPTQPLAVRLVRDRR